MKILRWLITFNFFLIFCLSINNSAFSKNINVPQEIQFNLNNSEYNKYLRRSMKAYTDGELYGKKKYKKKI